MTIHWLADKIEQWPTAKLVPYARNSRTHSDAQVAQTAPRLAVMRDDAERRRLIDAEVRRVRWMLRRELPRALRRMRSAGVKGEKSE